MQASHHIFSCGVQELYSTGLQYSILLHKIFFSTSCGWFSLPLLQLISVFDEVFQHLCCLTRVQLRKEGETACYAECAWGHLVAALPWVRDQLCHERYDGGEDLELYWWAVGD